MFVCFSRTIKIFYLIFLVHVVVVVEVFTLRSTDDDHSNRNTHFLVII